MAKKGRENKSSKQETLVNFILDKSGSMSSIVDSTISAFNEYVGSLKRDGNKYNFSLVMFDTEFSDRYTNVAIKDVDELTKESYVPDGGTALYDAVCLTLDQVKKTVKPTQKVLTVIMTDGEENSSKEYSQDQLKAKIKELEATGNWSFVFLGANQNSWASAGKMGIPTMNVSNFSATDKGMKSAMRVMASNTSAFAMNASLNTSAFFSKADQDNLSGGTAKDDIGQANVSLHMSSLGKKSWESRKRKMFGDI